MFALAIQQGRVRTHGLKPIQLLLVKQLEFFSVLYVVCQIL